MNTKLRIGIIFGGRSGEHEVSLRSARSVMAALDPAKYEVTPIGITKDGRWLAADAMGGLADGGAARAVTLLPEPADAALLAVDHPGDDASASTLSVMAPCVPANQAANSPSNAATSSPKI